MRDDKLTCFLQAAQFRQSVSGSEHRFQTHMVIGTIFSIKALGTLQNGQIDFFSFQPLPGELRKPARVMTVKY